jgi:hypothetical protein
MLSVLVFPTMVRSISKKIMVQASLDKKWAHISKITTAKRTGGVEQGVELLPGNYEALSSNPRTDTYTQKKSVT